MNKRQKFLDNEEAVIKRLGQVYGQSLKDINEKIKNLQFDIDGLQEEYDWVDVDDPKRAEIKSRIQSKIYQKQYQEQLQRQVDGILNQMQTKQFLTVADYLDECYTDGFIGTIFDAHGQGVPIVTPINQEAMVRAVQLDSKISKGLYTRLGEDVALLKKKITAQVSRSVATGMTYAQTAKQLAGHSRIGYNNAIRIARTEGHRIQTTATMDAMTAAKDKGADVVKQWDSTLDGRTRDSHAQVDGEIRELNKPFSNGLDFPGDPDGDAAEVINCRCALLQRARWALDDDELQTLKERAEYFGLNKSDEFDDFKKKCMDAAEQIKAAETADQPVLNKYGQAVVFDKRLESEKWSESTATIKDLANEYETRLTTVGVGSQGTAGSVDMGGAIRLSSNAKDVAIHEFAHSMATEALTKYGVVDDSAFWNEIKAVRRKYRHDVGDDAARWISSYEHSSKSVDEFFAEAFTQAKMKQLGLQLPSKYGSDFTYSDQVLQIVDKYFKKSLTKSSSGGIIQSDNITVRKWYLDKLSKIHDGIDPNRPLEDRARLAFEARNKIRTDARNMMLDQATRGKLDQEHPNLTFEEFIKVKMEKKGLTREEALQDIYESAKRSNKNVNKELGIEGGD